MRRNRIVWIVVVVVVVALAAWLATAGSTAVVVAGVGRGTVRRTVEEEGMTRVAERYVVAAPVSGRLLRVELEEGDRVEAGEVLARIEELPLASAVAAARARIDSLTARLAGVDRLRPKEEELARADAEVERAEAAAELAARELDEAKAAFEQAERDARRARELFADRTIPAAEKEDAELRETRARAALRAKELLAKLRGIEIRIARYGRAIIEASAHDVDWQEEQARAEIDAARADLAVVEDDLANREIRAPADGSVLRVMRESRAVVAAGTPILEIGDPGALEVEADLLSEDAARMEPGLRVEVFGRALGDRVLPGRLARIYPSAFTKISALGVEQQRTWVVVDLGEAAAALGLGDRYRVEVRVILEEKPDAVLVEEAALFRDGDAWHVFRVVDGSAVRTEVETGIRDGRFREVLSGLDEGDRVVLFPPDDLEDGAAVTPTDE